MTYCADSNFKISDKQKNAKSPTNYKLEWHSVEYIYPTRPLLLLLYKSQAEYNQCCKIWLGPI